MGVKITGTFRHPVPAQTFAEVTVNEHEVREGRERGEEVAPIKGLALAGSEGVARWDVGVTFEMRTTDAAGAEVVAAGDATFPEGWTREQCLAWIEEHRLRPWAEGVKATPAAPRWAE